MDNWRSANSANWVLPPGGSSPRRDEAAKIKWKKIDPKNTDKSYVHEGFGPEEVETCVVSILPNGVRDGDWHNLKVSFAADTYYFRPFWGVLPPETKIQTLKVK
jgi:hypothetical protein